MLLAGRVPPIDPAFFILARLLHYADGRSLAHGIQMKPEADVGKGSFGVVREMEYHGATVAVKEAKGSDGIGTLPIPTSSSEFSCIVATHWSALTRDDLSLHASSVVPLPDDEVDICVGLRPGPHIVQVLGICADAPDKKLRIVMEHCSLGTLRKFVADKASEGKVYCRCATWNHDIHSPLLHFRVVDSKLAVAVASFLGC